jgi:hypothetical protein
MIRLEDLTDDDVILGHPSRNTCGQVRWRKDRGPRRVLTEHEAICLLHQFEQPFVFMMVEENDEDDDKVNCRPSFSLSAVATASHGAATTTTTATTRKPRRRMKQRFITPRVLREKVKGVLHFATPQDVIRDVNGKRSVTDPNKATPSLPVLSPLSLLLPSPKKRSSPSCSTTKRQKKDPPMISSAIMPCDWTASSSSVAAAAGGSGSGAIVPLLDRDVEPGVMDGLFRFDDDGDADENPRSTRMEREPVRLCDFIALYQSKLQAWEHRATTFTTTAATMNRTNQCRIMMQQFRIVLRVYLLMPGVDDRPDNRIYTMHVYRSARQTIAAMWDDLKGELETWGQCHALSDEDDNNNNNNNNNGQSSSSYSSSSSGQEGNGGAPSRGPSNNPMGRSNNHRHPHNSSGNNNSNSNRGQSYHGSHGYSNNTPNQWRGSCESNPQVVDHAEGTTGLLTECTNANNTSIHRPSQDEFHPSDQDETTIDPDQEDNLDRESESESSSSDSKTTNDSSQDSTPGSSTTNSSSFYKVEVKDYSGTLCTKDVCNEGGTTEPAADSTISSEAGATAPDNDQRKEKETRTEKSSGEPTDNIMVTTFPFTGIACSTTVPAPAAARQCREWVKDQKEHTDPSVDLLSGILGTLAIQNLDVKPAALTRADYKARINTTWLLSSSQMGESIDVTDPHDDTKALIKAFFEGSEFQSDPTMFVEMVLDLMRNSNIGDKDVQGYCLAQMREASKQNTTCASAFITGMAAHDVLLALKRFPKDTSIQSAGCIVLWRWCEVPHAREALISAGACAQVLETLRTFMKDHQEQISAYEALMLSAGDCHHQVLETLHWLIKDQEQIIAYAVCALGSLSMHVQGRKALNKMNATQTVVQVMGYHLSSRPIQKYGCTSLCNCVKDKDRKFIASLKVVPEVNAVVQSILNHSSMLVWGCSILRKYIDMSMNPLYLEQCDDYDKLFTALNSYKSEVEDAQFIVKRLRGLNKKATTASTVTSIASKSKEPLALALADPVGEDGASIALEQEVANQHLLG